MSEWQAVVRHGSNWYRESDICANYHPLHGHMKRCPFKHMQEKARKLKKKFKLSFNEFVSCPGNKANNRQTRMLANLTNLHCDQANYTTFEKLQRSMLESAKYNILKLTFFGLTGYQKETQLLFEETFGVHFKKQFKQKIGIAKLLVHNLTSEQIGTIAHLVKILRVYN